MFGGKRKVVTFSYDDGVWQDRKLVELFNRYGLRGTFNLNSEQFGRENDTATYFGKTIVVDTIKPEEVATLYKGHEVAVHTLTHPNLTQCSDEEIVRQVECDRVNLSGLAGYEVIGMAYPCGGVNNNDHVARVIKENTGIRYARTITSTGEFEFPSNLYRLNPSIYHLADCKSPDAMSGRLDDLMEKAEEFLRADRGLFYVWGHSYEFDLFDGAWERFEEFCAMICGKEDIFYGTNREVLFSDKF